MKKTIDIFCDIIDNYGDIGIVYRLSRELKKNNYSVRIFVNKFEEVSKIIENFNSKLNYQKIDEIEFFSLENFNIKNGASIVIEAFGIEIPDFYINKLDESSKILINLEYLSAEEWIEDIHLNKSISPKPWIEKYFFMPGFSEKTGGIILDEVYLLLVQKIKDNRIKYFNDFYKNLNITYDKNNFYINIFTYNWDFHSFLKKIEKIDRNFVFFILDNRFEIDYPIPKNVRIYKLPYMNQEKFDIYINLSDFNFVRGEDSFVRAILSEKPFIWNIYPQEDEYHLIKLKAFLEHFSSSRENSALFYELNMNFNKHMDFSKEFYQIINNNSTIYTGFKNELIKNCDLVTKLLNFIDSKLKT